MISSAFSSAGNILLLAFGFGFVIFWHELGHFLAAKWADVKVEQFAVGFGQAVFSWRKGLGFRWGSTQTEFQSKLRDRVEQGVGTVNTPRVPDEAAAGVGTFNDLPTDEPAKLPGDPTDAELTRAAGDLGLSETEYRLNWIPLGGYVKMLGQDDLRPGAVAPDPRSYTSKPVAKRMVIVSAGVVMNVILAAIGFIVLFKVGYRVPPATVGEVGPGSPAQNAVRVVDGKVVPSPILPGDTILKIDGKWQSDFDKIRLNSPLLIAKEPVPVDVRRADGTVEHLTVTPDKPTPQSEFPLLGIAPAKTLKGPGADDVVPDLQPTLESAEFFTFKKGDVITAVNGRAVTPGQFFVLADAIQAGGGRPVPVTVHNDAGADRSVAVTPHFAERFGNDPVDFAGLQMLPQVVSIDKDSSANGLILPGDVVTDVADVNPSGGHRPMPTKAEMTDFTRDAGASGSKLLVTVLRDGKPVPPVQVTPNLRLDRDHRGLGVALAYADGVPIVAHPQPGTPADAAHVPGGAVLRTVDGKPVRNWFDVYDVFCKATADRPIPLTAAVDGQNRAFTLPPLTAAALDGIRQNRLDSYATEILQPDMTVLKAANIGQAFVMGVGETRDAILQVYLTVRAMVRGSISPREISGPVGILTVGYKFAQAGSTRLLWFLSIISANLAVMNFLPIPVVDGGLFTFLVIEKLKGSPISQRTQSIAQVVGLALLLSVFLFATYQDVFNRLPFLTH